MKKSYCSPNIDVFKQNDDVIMVSNKNNVFNIDGYLDDDWE